MSQPNILALVLWHWSFAGYRQIAAICTGKLCSAIMYGKRDAKDTAVEIEIVSAAVNMNCGGIH